jgi:hypothetical protein
MRWTPLIGLAIALLLISACSMVQTAQPVANSSSPLLTQSDLPELSFSQADSSITPEPPDRLANAIKSALSAETQVPTSSISLKSAEAVNWNDGCLGLARPDEVCLMAITPGYRMIFGTPTRDYEVHSDRQRTFRRAE